MRRNRSVPSLARQEDYGDDDGWAERPDSSANIYNNWAFGNALSETEQEDIQRQFETCLIDTNKLSRSDTSKIFRLEDALSLVTEGMQNVVNDSFTKCFKRKQQTNWNWNVYLFITWSFGVFLRYCVLFPCRVFGWLTGHVMFLVAFFSVSYFVKIPEKRLAYQKKCCQFLASVYVMSWNGVIKYHGVRPKHEANQIYVANHSSLIDIIILMQSGSYAIVGQQHTGFVGFMQNKVLACLGCIWFNRNESKDRVAVARKITSHIQDPNNNPLLIFPEGTCVNNDCIVMFKKGAFGLPATIIPVAIKYNKLFADAYWVSRQESFASYLVRLMTSWAVVCDVWYLEPQTRAEGESALEFANRVKEMIGEKAKLENLPWDGYLKHFRPSDRFVTHRRLQCATSMLRRFPSVSEAQAQHASPASVRIRRSGSQSITSETPPNPQYPPGHSPSLSPPPSPLSSQPGSQVSSLVQRKGVAAASSL